MGTRLIIGIVSFYRKYISGLKRVPSCRFYPTCSQYAIDALNTYGFFKGSFMSIRRILKCHPFNPGGYDPVK